MRTMRVQYYVHTKILRICQQYKHTTNITNIMITVLPVSEIKQAKSYVDVIFLLRSITI